MDAERELAASAVACPSAVDAALADVPLLPSEIDDPIACNLICATVLRASPFLGVGFVGLTTATAIVKLAASGLRSYRIPFDQDELATTALSFCPTCIADGVACRIARFHLPRVAGQLAGVIDRLRDAQDALRFAEARLRGAA